MKKPPITVREDEVGPEEFSTAITRIAVAQVCQSVGYRGAQRSALETLTDVAARFLKSLAKSAVASANSGGRTQSNYLDIVCALEELHSGIGYRGRSNVGQSLFRSSTVVDVMRFVRYSREIPFAKPVPRRRHGLVLPGWIGNGNGGGNHIPKWLPAIPVMGCGEEECGIIESRGEVVCLGGKKMVMAMEREREGENRRELVLPRKRERVSFKMGGVGMRMAKGKGMNDGLELVKSGICRGGKRISCQTWRVGDDVEDEGTNNNSINSNYSTSIGNSNAAGAIKKACTKR